MGLVGRHARHEGGSHIAIADHPLREAVNLAEVLHGVGCDRARVDVGLATHLNGLLHEPQALLELLLRRHAQGRIDLLSTPSSRGEEGRARGAVEELAESRLRRPHVLRGGWDQRGAELDCKLESLAPRCESGGEVLEAGWHQDKFLALHARH